MQVMCQRDPNEFSTVTTSLPRNGFQFCKNHVQ